MRSLQGMRLLVRRDELEILIEGLEASKFGSAGEQRSALITLDLAQITVYNSAFEEYPVFLIDDIDAELDSRRISLLLDYIEGKMQVFVSTSKRTIAAQYQTRAACRFISNGRIVSAPAFETETANRAGEEVNIFAEDEDALNLSEMARTTLVTQAALATQATMGEPEFNISSEEFCDSSEEKHRAPF